MANSYIQVPPDSTGKKVQHIEHIIGANTVQTQAIHIADQNNPENIQHVNDYGAASITFNEGQPTLDAFGNLRVANQYVIGAYDNAGSDQASLYTTEELVNGTVTYDIVSSTVSLTTTAEAGSTATRTTNRYHYYLPGTGMLIYLTLAVGDTGKENNTRGWGYYDTENGMFFELKGTALGVVVRSNATGTVIDNRIEQADWNGDKLDGNGFSGFTLDITKRNLYWIDFAWLGVGGVRFGVYGASGERITCHSFIHAGGIAYPYNRSATLPVRFENRNTGATGSVSELRTICAAVYSEAQPDYAFWRYDLKMTTPKSVTTNTPLLGIKTKTYRDEGNVVINRVNSYPDYFSVYVTGGPIKLEFYFVFAATDFTNATWTLDAGPLLGDEAATAVTIGADSRSWCTYYLDPGSHTINVADLFPLNDEGILLYSVDDPGGAAIVATKLNGGDTVSALVSMNFKELS